VVITGHLLPPSCLSPCAVALARRQRPSGPASGTFGQHEIGPSCAAGRWMEGVSAVVRGGAQPNAPLAGDVAARGAFGLGYQVRRWSPRRGWPASGAPRTLGGVRRWCAIPRPDRISIRPAAMKVAMAPMNMICPICQNRRRSAAGRAGSHRGRRSAPRPAVTATIARPAMHHRHAGLPATSGPPG